MTQDCDRHVDLSQTDSTRGFEDCGHKSSTAAGICASDARPPGVAKDASWGTAFLLCRPWWGSMKKICEKCGTLFIAEGQRIQTGRFCSRVCASAVPPAHIKQCASCGRDFAAQTPQVRYCSYKCRHSRPPPQFQTCRVCGTEFLPALGNKGRPACSAQCATIWQRWRHGIPAAPSPAQGHEAR